jgi:hypothetical protein
MDEVSAANLVAAIEAVRARPAMYLGAVAVAPAIAWLDGFAAAVSALYGGEGELAARERVLTARGWSWSARHPAEEMAERGLSPAEVVDELLAVECDVLRQRLTPDQSLQRTPLRGPAELGR